MLRHGDSPGALSGAKVKRATTAPSSSVYKLEELTVFSLQFPWPIEGPPNVLTVISESDICFALKDTVFIFSLLDVHSTMKMTIQLGDDCTVTQMTLNADSSFLILSDSLGSIHFVLTETCQIVFSQDLAFLAQEADCDGPLECTTLQLFPDGNMESLVVFFKGIAVRFYNIDTKAVKDAIQRQDAPAAAQLKSSIKMEVIPLNDDLYQVDNAKALFPAHHLPEAFWCFGHGQYPLTLWQTRNGTTSPIDGLDSCLLDGAIVKVAVAETERLLLLLTENGTLSIWDAECLVPLKTLQTPGLLDFDYFHTVSLESKADPIFISALMQDSSVVLMDLRTESMIFEQCSSPGSRLVSPPATTISRAAPSETPSVFHDSCFLTNLKNHEDQVAVSFQKIYKTLPIHQFQYLLESKQYESAEALALKFGMDEQFVKRIKMNWLMDSSELDALSVDSILVELDQISDEEFCVNLCMEASITEPSLVQRFLDYAQHRVRNGRDSISRDLACKLQKTIKRFGTHQLLCLKDAAQALCWPVFRVADLAKQMSELLICGRMEEAIIIWQRHSTEEHFMVQFEMILSSVPRDVSFQQIYSFTRNEIISRVRQEQDIDILMGWIEARARIIEDNEGKPHHALSFINLVNVFSDLNTLSSFPLTPQIEVENVIICSHLHFIKTSENDVQRHPIFSLMLQLEDLVHVWDNHNLQLTLDAFSQMTPGSIATEFLDRTSSPALLAKVVTEDFKPYLKRSELDAHEVLIDYCIHLLNSGGYDMETSNSWIPRFHALFACVEDGERKMELALEFMRRLPIPWCAQSDKVIQEVLSQKTYRKHIDVMEQYRLMNLKKTLLNYGIKAFNISDLNLAKGLLQFILSKVEIRHAMMDASRLIDAYHHLNLKDALVMRTRFLLKARLVHHAMSLIENGREDTESDSVAPIALKKANQISICQEIIIWILDVLETRHPLCQVSSGTAEEYLHYMKSVYEFSKLHTSLGANSDVFGLESVDFDNMYILAKDFDIAILPSDYTSSDNRMRLLERFLESNEEVDSAQAWKLASRLKITETSLKRSLAIKAAHLGRVQSASVICRDIMGKSKSHETGLVLMEVASALVKHTRESNSTPNSEDQMTKTCLRLSGEALSLVEPLNILDSLDRFKDLEIKNKVFLHCDAGDYRKLLDRNGKTKSSSYNAHPVGGASSSSGISSSSMPLTMQPKLSHSNALCVEGDLLRSRLLAGERYHDGGLVLPTKSTMDLVTAFTLEASQWSNAGPLKPSNEKNKTGRKTNPSNTGRLLVQLARDNRLYELSFRILNRVCELDRRFVNLTTVKEGNRQHLDSYWETLQRLLQNVLSSMHIDQKLGLGFMVGLPMDKAFESFKAGMATTGRDYSRLVQVAGIGTVAGMIWNQRSFQVDCQALALNAKWWHTLTLLEIPFDDASFRSSLHGLYQKSLISMILDKASLEVALDYCRDYRIDGDYVYLERVKQLLDPLTSHNDYQVQVNTILPLISNAAELSSQVKMTCLPKMSSYDYERLQFSYSLLVTLELHEESIRKGALTLDIISVYTRLIPADVEELRRESKRCARSPSESKRKSTLEFQKELPLSTSRLPFHELLQDPWKVLIPELSEATIPRLLPLCHPLGLNQDKFYSTVIDNLVERLKKEQKRKDSSQNSSCPPVVPFAELRCHLGKLKDLELAVQTTVFIAGVYPCGVDRIAAYKCALIFAEKWQQATKNDDVTHKKSEMACSRVKQLLSNTETESQLQSCQLSDFIPFMSNPLDLVVRIYTAKSNAAHKDSGNSMSKLQIMVAIFNSSMEKESLKLHCIVNAIGKRHAVNLDKVRLMLVQKWLTQDESHFKDILLPSTRFQIRTSQDGESESVIQERILYLLKSSQFENNCIQLLLTFAYQQNSKIQTTTRVRALSVLFQLADKASLESKKVNAQELQMYMKMLLYLADFEELRILQSLKEFHECDKLSLARSLWLHHRDDIRAIQIICNICMDYHIVDHAIWENVLTQLFLKHYNPLFLRVLEHVVSDTELSSLEILCTIWDDVFSVTLSDPSHDLKNLLRIWVKSSSMSPLLVEQLSVEVIQRHASGQFSAIEALQHLSIVPQALEGIHRLTMSLSSSELNPVLEALNEGDLDATFHSEDIRRAAFERIDEIGCYQELLGTSFLYPMVSHLVSVKKLHKLVRFSLEQKRDQAAKDMIRLFNQTHGRPEPEGDEALIQDFLDLEKE